MKHFTKKVLLTTTALAVFAMFTQTAAAVPALKITATGGPVGGIQIDDESLNDNLKGPGFAGAINFAGTLGVFNLNVVTGQTKPILGTSIFPAMDLGYVNTSTGAGTVVMEFSDTGYFGIDPTMLFGNNDGNSFSNNTTITYELFLDTNNTLFGTGAGTLVGSTGPTTGNVWSQSFPAFTLPVAAGPNGYSLTQRITLVHDGATTSSGDAKVQVPEPSMLALLGLGLLGFVGARRFNKK